MEKFRYGTKEIIATLVGAALVVGTCYPENFMFASLSEPLNSSAGCSIFSVQAARQSAAAANKNSLFVFIMIPPD